MRRLYDRMNTGGWRRLSRLDLQEHHYGLQGPRLREEVRKQLVANPRGSDRPPTERDIDMAIARGRNEARQHVSPLNYLSRALDGAVVVRANDVATYFNALAAGANVSEIANAAPAVPPYLKMFIEFDSVPNGSGFQAWGVLVESLREPTGKLAAPDAHWFVGLALFGEWKTGDPVGPLLLGTYHLDINGFLLRSTGNLMSGQGEVGSGYVGFSNVPVPGPQDEDEDGLVVERFHDQMLPALLTVAFMHAKNVDVLDVVPDPKEAAAFRKRHGKPPVRFKTLDIGPLRRVLDSQGHADRDGLGAAMHLCRGHFKTFTEEAPLFGRLTGTYWWEPQVRGDAAKGRVDKEYRMRVESEGVGRGFEALDEHVELTETETEDPRRDPDLGGRGLRAHNRTVNQLAIAARAAGCEPLLPRPDDPQFDLAFYVESSLWVVEVKSITQTNEERQLRMAFGQVSRYCQALSDAGVMPKPVVGIESHPFDESWIDLCNEKGIVPIWPEVFALALSGATTGP